MYECPECKTEVKDKMAFLSHLVYECNYSYFVAIEIGNEQDELQ